jgi:protein tyrosine phosphatase
VYPDKLLLFLRATSLGNRSERCPLSLPLLGLVGPSVVHCSAGIGRSGTFIAIDMLLNNVLQPRHLRDEEAFPQTVYEAVRWLRLRRKGMIQSLDQYKFIFKVLEEFKSTIALSDEDEDWAFS